MIANDTFRYFGMQHAILDPIVDSFIAFGGCGASRCFISTLFEETFSVDIAKRILWLSHFGCYFGLLAINQRNVFVEILFVHNGQFKSLYLYYHPQLLKLN